MGNQNKGGSQKRNPNKRPGQYRKKKQSGIGGMVAAIGILIVIIGVISMALINQPATPKPTTPQTASSQPAIDGIKCETMEGSALHIHAHLKIINNGQEVEVPANIGITNAAPATCLYWLHTHDNSGEIHIESPQSKSFTLGNFFDIWKQPLTKTAVLGFSDNGKPVKAYVDGKEFTGDPRTIELQKHSKIVLEVGPKFVPPTDTFEFPQGD